MTSGGTTPGIQAYLGLLGSLDALAEGLSAVGSAVVGCPSPELGALLGRLTRVRALAAAAQVAVVREAAERGVISESDAASPTDWITTQSSPPDLTTVTEGTTVPGSAPLPAPEAAVLARVAHTCRRADWQPVDRALLAANLSPNLADRIVKEHTRLKDALPQSMHADVLSGFVTLAATGAGASDLIRYRERLIAHYAAEGTLQLKQDRQATHRALSGFARDLDGMYHATVILDPESHALIAPVIDALSAPVTTTDEHGHPVRDERTGDQRRADALVEICSAYQDAGNKARLGAATRLVVTMSLEQLQSGTGCGTTPTGEALAPDTVRKLACDAAIIPMVLGSQAEPLDVGRESRLVTPAQLAALRQRDKGCTFPGCQRPPAWTVAHHILHWLFFGPTNLDNLTLLCRRHHTIVHQRGYTATVTPTGVTWHIDHPATRCC